MALKLPNVVLTHLRVFNVEEKQMTWDIQVNEDEVCLKVCWRGQMEESLKTTHRENCLIKCETESEAFDHVYAKPSILKSLVHNKSIASTTAQEDKLRKPLATELLATEGTNYRSTDMCSIAIQEPVLMEETLTKSIATRVTPVKVLAEITSKHCNTNTNLEESQGLQGQSSNAVSESDSYKKSEKADSIQSKDIGSKSIQRRKKKKYKSVEQATDLHPRKRHRFTEERQPQLCHGSVSQIHPLPPLGWFLCSKIGFFEGEGVMREARSVYGDYVYCSYYSLLDGDLRFADSRKLSAGFMRKIMNVFIDAPLSHPFAEENFTCTEKLLEYLEKNP